MVTSFIISLFSLFVQIFGAIGSTIQVVIPQWFTDGINNIFHGSGWLNTFLPIYPHIGYAGLAGETGIMPMFGWFLYIVTFFVIVKLMYWMVKLLISILPWNTSQVSDPHNISSKGWSGQPK